MIYTLDQEGYFTIIIIISGIDIDIINITIDMITIIDIIIINIIIDITTIIFEIITIFYY